MFDCWYEILFSVLIHLGYLNDMWVFNGVNWTWIAGSNNINQHGEYGEKGVPDNENYPGGRAFAYYWVDSNKNLYIFGGYGYGNSGGEGIQMIFIRMFIILGLLNDLWKFDGYQWTWLSGSNSINDAGSFGEMNVPAKTNVPPARSFGSNWIDQEDNLYLFGGIHCGSPAVACGK